MILFYIFYTVFTTIFDFIMVVMVSNHCSDASI